MGRGGEEEEIERRKYGTQAHRRKRVPVIMIFSSKRSDMR